VRQALNATDLHEFYANISFDANNQISAPMLVVQMQPKKVAAEKQAERVVADGLATFVYPVPSWARRRCEALGPGHSANNSLAAATSSDFIPLTERPSNASAACSGHGSCSAHGDCTCDDMYAGLHCQFNEDHMGFCAPLVTSSHPHTSRPRV